MITGTRMTITTRTYQPGDEVLINNLYKIVANIDRNKQEYEWEWIDTWDGPGFVRLMFDNEREEENRLVAQYSLIPTPFSFWGHPYVAGKTENCMCHPDYRGKGIYFPHEKKSFEEARQRFQLFFTTNGNATKGAPGAVRRKLGYIAFDSWVYCLYVTNHTQFSKFLMSGLKRDMHSDPRFLKILISLMSRIIYAYYALYPRKKNRHEVRLHGEKDALLIDIERLWNRNKAEYGISVDRTTSYLDWRINRNPYYDHQYLCAYDGENLIGYIIFHKSRGIIRIIDILADRKDNAIFSDLIQNLILYAKSEKRGAVYVQRYSIICY